MSQLNELDLKGIFEEEFGPIKQSKSTLYVVLGLLGDFDSFEFIQSLLTSVNKKKDDSFDFYVIGIGNSKSKKYFCDYTKLPQELLRVVETNTLHNKLDLNKGLDLPISPLLNLMLMCMGIYSKGTLAEVLRGYVGDRNAQQLFNNDEKISFFNKIVFKADLFNLLGGNGFQRPFELASLRLMNMIEVISNWNIYMTNNLFLTQRSGIFLVDSSDKIIYSYKSRGLLDYAETMSNPMEFLYNTNSEL